MFVPGVLTSAAQPVTFLGQIANGGAGLGFRTNAGAFNPGDAPVSARFDVFNDAGQILGSQTRPIAAHSGVQINNIFGAIGHGSDAVNDAVIVVTGTAELFSYAAVIDNETTDPFLVIGAGDVPAPPGHVPPPAPTQTPAPQATPRPTPTPTPAPQGQTVVVNVGQGRSQLRGPGERLQHDADPRRGHRALGLGRRLPLDDVRFLFRRLPGGRPLGLGRRLRNDVREEVHAGRKLPVPLHPSRLRDDRDHRGSVRGDHRRVTAFVSFPPAARKNGRRFSLDQSRDLRRSAQFEEDGMTGASRRAVS